MRAFFAIVVSSMLAGPMSAAQRPAQLSQQVRGFVKVDAQVIALTNARVIDGTGAAAKPQQTILIRDDKIVAVGPSASVTVPQGANVIDLTGKTVFPGLVMLHEHLYYPVGSGVYGQLGASFV